MAKKFPKLMTNTKPQMQKAQRTPSRINTNKATPGHDLFKVRKQKTKRKSRKNSEEKYILPIKEQGKELT